MFKFDPRWVKGLPGQSPTFVEDSSGYPPKLVGMFNRPSDAVDALQAQGGWAPQTVTAPDVAQTHFLGGTKVPNWMRPR